MTSDTNKLFNAIVVLGAALVSGCSSGSGDGSSSSAGGASNDNSGMPQFNVSKDAGNSDAAWTGW